MDSYRTAVLLLLSCSGVVCRVVDTLVYEEFANCDDKPRPAYLIDSKVIKLRSGATVVRADANVTIPLSMKHVVVDTFTCDIKTRSKCHKFLNWKFDKDVCVLATKKDMLWSPMFATQPPLQCPVQMGVYHIENATLDNSKISRFGLASNVFVRVILDVFDNKKKSTFCLKFGGFLKGIKV